VEGELDFFEIRDGFRRKTGKHLLKKGFQRIEKDGSLENLEQIPAHV
jgi:hypothetical protein